MRHCPEHRLRSRNGYQCTAPWYARVEKQYGQSAQLFSQTGRSCLSGQPKPLPPQLDACVGYARKHQLFPAEEMVSTGTLYNMVWAGLLPIAITELPEALKRSTRECKPREHKKCYSTSISERTEIVTQRIEEGHWEGDTVVGKRDGQDAVVLSLLEEKTQHCIAIRIPGKTSEAVLEAVKGL